ncbi:hypothetical protein [Micromonospora sp. NPDC005161]
MSISAPSSHVRAVLRGRVGRLPPGPAARVIKVIGPGPVRAARPCPFLYDEQ